MARPPRYSQSMLINQTPKQPNPNPAGDFVRQVGKKVIDGDFGTELPEQDRDTLVLTTASGAVLGAAVGTYLGFQSQADNRVSEEWRAHNITHPHLTGYSHSAVPDYDRECHYEGSGEDRREVCTDKLEGWWHRYSPDIRNDKVGSYTAPEFHNSNWSQPLLGGFLGALGGGLLGLGIGIGANALKRSLNHGEEAGAVGQTLPEAKRQELHQTAGLLALGGAAVGVVGGGVLGHVSGVIEQAQKEVHTRDWMGPVLQNQRIGQIPSDYYEHNIGLGLPGLGIGFGRGSQGVYRDVPVYGTDGTPQLQRVQHTFDTARYGPVSGAIMGGIIGGGVGLAAGIAGGTLLKMVESRPQEKGKDKPQ